MERLRRLWRLAAFGLVFLTLPAREVSAYSVLAHEAMVDVSWSDRILPALKQRFPRASSAELDAARAYAYGGSLIQDLGYYPFGSHFFSNLVHYVRSGDFVEALVRDASDPNEYAFALGALAHYSSDNAGHPFAVNLVVPVMYPKLGAKYGPQVLYADSPARHVMVEFAFDVMEVGRGRFRSDEYQSLIGFQVAVALLERAFRETYGLELHEVLGDADLAIGTFRHAASELVPQVTRAAWKEKRDDILAANPTLAERDVVYSMTRAEYEQAFGTTYRKPGFLARFVVTVFKLLPKFGPFKPLAFQPLTPPTETDVSRQLRACAGPVSRVADRCTTRPARPSRFRSRYGRGSAAWRQSARRRDLRRAARARGQGESGEVTPALRTSHQRSLLLTSRRSPRRKTVASRREKDRQVSGCLEHALIRRGLHPFLLSSCSS